MDDLEVDDVRYLLYTKGFVVEEPQETKQLKARLLEMEEECAENENEKEELVHACAKERDEIQDYLEKECIEVARSYRLECLKFERFENQLRLRNACNRGFMTALEAREKRRIALDQKFNETKRATEFYKKEVSRLRKSIKKLHDGTKGDRREATSKKSDAKNIVTTPEGVKIQSPFNNAHPILPPIKSKQNTSYFIPNSPLPTKDTLPPPTKDALPLLPTPPTSRKPEARYVRKFRTPSSKKPLPPIGQQKEVLLPLSKRLP